MLELRSKAAGIGDDVVVRMRPVPGRSGRGDADARPEAPPRAVG